MGKIIAKVRGQEELELFGVNQEGSGIEIKRPQGVPVFVTLLDHDSGREAVLDIYHDGVLVEEQEQMYMSLAEGEEKKIQTEAVDDVTIRHERE